jgi:hypothetical protein
MDVSRFVRYGEKPLKQLACVGSITGLKPSVKRVFAACDTFELAPVPERA